MKARFEVKPFIVCLQQTDKENVEACAPPLQVALLNVSLVHAHLDEETTAARLDYVIDRLK